jgi:hypothetical protein
LPRETIAVRGLDFNLYNELFSRAKKDGKRVSDLMNEAIKNEIQILSGNGEPEPIENHSSPQIDNAGSITLSRVVISNLHQEMGDFSIRNSGKLVFDRDVDGASLSHVHSIVNSSSGTIRAPKSIYHLILLKSQNVGSLEMY